MVKGFIDNTDKKIAVIGLGYVGLPLAVEFGKKFVTVGFDVDQNRLDQLRIGIDSSLELSKEELTASVNLSLTNELSGISECNVYIVTVPTPINENNQPDLTFLLNASESIGKVLERGDIVIYESTVYPGATEEECVPILEKISGLLFNKDFFVGYSPERINPGDKEHRLTNILKVTSGSTKKVADQIDQLYGSIITAGTYQAKSIRVAEAAKVIENTQRDVNIGLINEFALIFNKLGIDTEEVLNTAETKWNFLPFRPGLVGGHCIGVDPYYLTYKAQSIGYDPEIILAGRRLNDGMGTYVANQIIKALSQKEIKINESHILIMGLTFKENCPDLRNSKVVEIIKELQDVGAQVDCFDPWVDPKEAEQEYRISPIAKPSEDAYDAIVLAVGHKEFRNMSEEAIRLYGKDNHILCDIKYLLPRESSDLRL